MKRMFNISARGISSGFGISYGFRSINGKNNHGNITRSVCLMDYVH